MATARAKSIEYRVPGLSLGWGRRRLDVSVAAAAVLLAQDTVELEPTLDDGDLFTRFELTRDLAKAEPALRAGHVGLIEAEDHILDGKRKLLGGSVPLLRLLGPGPAVAASRRLFGGVAEEGLVAQRQQLAQALQLQLHRVSVTALEPNQLVGELGDTRDEAIILPFEKKGDLLEDRHVALGTNVDRHALYRLASHPLCCQPR